MDRIRIKGIVCQVRLGVPQQERAQPQNLQVDALLEMDLEAAANTDDLALGVDYHEITTLIQKAAAEREFRLAEALAAHLCRTILVHSPVERVRLTVRKFPQALRGTIDCVEVEMSRSR